LRPRSALKFEVADLRLALTSGIFGNKLSIRSETITKLEEKFSRGKLENFPHEFNTAGRIEALTEKEGRFILRQLSLNSLRDRILADAQEANISPTAWQIQASFSRLAAQSSPTTNTTAEQVKSELLSQHGAVVQKRLDAGDLVILPNSDGLPPDVLKSGVAGAYLGKQDTIYLVANQIEQGKAGKLLYHEALHRAMSTGKFAPVLAELAAIIHVLIKLA
jgi:hypothetical protein